MRILLFVLPAGSVWIICRCFECSWTDWRDYTYVTSDLCYRVLTRYMSSLCNVMSAVTIGPVSQCRYSWLQFSRVAYLKSGCNICRVCFNFTQWTVQRWVEDPSLHSGLTPSSWELLFKSVYDIDIDTEVFICCTFLVQFSFQNFTSVNPVPVVVNHLVNFKLW